MPASGTYRVAIAGAQHSMGGHTIAPDGLRLDMRPFRAMALDPVTGILTVGSGALWADVIPFLNRYGRAVATMQSDNAFSVGGSLSVNCHGWQHNQPPIAATVESFRLLLANGALVRCSRTENGELFSLALGGYGLFGVILDARLRTVPNEVYVYRRVLTSADGYLAEYEKHVDRNSLARLVYGRLNVTEEDFLRHVTLNYFERVRRAPADYPLHTPGLTNVKRGVFLASKRNAYGKQLRWDTEQTFGQTQIGHQFSRNEIMNESPALYLNRASGRTDILHEYFIPRATFGAFVAALRQRVPRHQADLLNVTIRNVYADHDTFLQYAPAERFAFVLFFDQAMTPAAERDMAALTHELIADAQRLGGAYYLPYRLHATPAQFAAAYPMSAAFFAKKRQYDSSEVFQNAFYQRYGRGR